MKFLRIVSLTLTNFSAIISLKDFFKITFIVFSMFFLLFIVKLYFFNVLSSLSYIITSFSDNLKHNLSLVTHDNFTVCISESSTFLINSSTNENYFFYVTYSSYESIKS
jgi:hypothetical protein